MKQRRKKKATLKNFLYCLKAGAWRKTEDNETLKSANRKLEKDNRELQKELKRKEKALAEMPALYTLKKKQMQSGRKTGAKNNGRRQASCAGTYYGSTQKRRKTFQSL
jgi:hypothetical protein